MTASHVLGRDCDAIRAERDELRAVLVELEQARAGRQAWADAISRAAHALADATPGRPWTYHVTDSHLTELLDRFAKGETRP